MTFTFQLTDAQWRFLSAAISQQTALLQKIVSNQQSAMVAESGAAIDLEQLAADVASIRNTLIGVFRPEQPKMPGVVVLSQTQEDEMKKFSFALTLTPPDPTGGTVKRTIEWTIADQKGTFDLADVTSVQSPAFVGALGDVVTADVIDTDDAGNASKPSPLFTWTVVDEVAPPQPGMPGVVELAEVAEDTPTGPVVVA